MSKASVHEHGDARGPHDHVRRAGQVISVHSKQHPSVREQLTDDALRPRVPTANPRHVDGSFVLSHGGEARHPNRSTTVTQSS
jgi:hypothetical protein